jgi:fibronectin-binding autotransporter adhesin
MASYQFFGSDMDVATNYQPDTGSLPTAGDTVTTVANAPAGFLDNASLTIGTFNNTDLIEVFDGATLTVTTYNDTGQTAISTGGILTVNGDYTANSVHIGNAGSKLVVNGTLTVSNGGISGVQGLYVSNGVTETWSNVVLAGSGASPLQVDTSASIEITGSLTSQGGGLNVTNGGAATIDTDFVMSSGDIQVGVLRSTGPSPATATFKGNMALNGASGGVSVFTHVTLTVQGNLTVNGQGGLGVAGGTAVVHGSSGMTIGVDGTGDVTVKSGGQLTVDHDVDIAAQAASTDSSLFVTDPFSKLTVNNLVLGDAGGGGFTVLGSASAEVKGNLTAGNQQGAEGDLNVLSAGSVLTIDGNTILGKGGVSATSQVSAGGNLSVIGTLTLGALQTGSGTLAIVGQNSQLSTNGADVIIGDLGKGTLTVQNNASVLANNSVVTIANQQGSVGSLQVTGSAAMQAKTLHAGAAGKASVLVDQDGELTVDGLTVDGPSGQVNVQSGGSVTVNGTATLGQTNGSNSVVTITGTGSLLRWQNFLTVGVSTGTTASLSVTAGGVVDLIPNSSNPPPGALEVGLDGGTGSVFVDGTDSLLHAKIAILGAGGSLTASNGGTIHVDQRIADTVSEGGFHISATSGARITVGPDQPSGPGITIEHDGTGLLGSARFRPTRQSSILATSTPKAVF